MRNYNVTLTCVHISGRFPGVSPLHANGSTVGLLYSRTGLRLCVAVFRILSVTFSLTHALSKSLAHAQQRFSAEGLHFSAFIHDCRLVMSMTTSNSSEATTIDGRPRLKGEGK